MARVLWVGVFALASVFARAGEAVPSADYAWPDLTDFLKQLVGKVGASVKVYKLEMDRDGKVDLWIQNQARPDLVDTLHIAVSPVDLGDGLRLWDSPDDLLDRFHRDVVPSPSGVTHHLYWRK